MKKLTALILAAVVLLSLPVSAAAAEDFLYTDEITGAGITVPGGWKLEYEDDGVLFVPRGTSVTMRYQYADLWSQLSESEQQKTPREEFDSDQTAKADIADLLEVRSKEVKIVNLAGTEYFQATTVVKKGFFIFKTKTTVISLVHVANGYAHIFRFEEDEAHDLYPAFEDMVAATVYGAAEADSPAPTETEPAETVKTDADIYWEAVDAYDGGYYAIAKILFNSVSTYEDSQKYLRLIRIRDYGSNTGIGCVYDYRKALTDEQKAEIDEAAADFYFADTAGVLLCNTDVACYYLGAHNGLSGNWVTGSGAPKYAYFKLHKDSSGGYYYTRSTNLSKAVSDCVSIIDGDVRISITSSNTLVFRLELTGPDSMLIWSHETGMVADLYRQ